ncbi:MAG: FHA domain-containing protein [Lachnospiraceae bacterium]|nr:FHA domain-containing protein [Lachnospiraceae bacterium]
MRTFNFKARNIGEEKYLTYTMGEECELDEDVLDYCEENDVKEILDIIYEEDDDYDYLTYDITGRVTLENYIKREMNAEKVLNILRNVASSLISLKEQAVQLSYILLNKSFVYIDEKTYELKFICLPIESKGSLAVEFKGFVRQLLANMKYDVDEGLGYVGKLLTYINGDTFNLRGLVGLAEALMEECDVSFEEAGTIEAEDGVEVVSDEPEIKSEGTAENVADFMNNAVAEDEVLPEIGDDEEDEEDEDEIDSSLDEELDSILPAGMKVVENAADGKSAEDIENAIPEIPVEEFKEEEIKEEEVPQWKAEEAKEEVPQPQVEETKEEKPQPQVEQIKAEQQQAPPVKVEDEQQTKKETDVDLIKSRIKELVGAVPTAKTKSEGDTIKTLEELDEFLDSKPPVVKKNVVKVNRAALIQSVAEHEGATEELIGDGEPIKPTKKSGKKSNKGEVPVIQEVYEDANAAKPEKPKSNSVLSKSVDDPNANSNLNVPKANPYIVRVNTEERIMITKTTFKIGKAMRGVDYTVSGNGAVSRQHAAIIQRDGVCYIKDNKSTNHTYVNGRMVEEGAEEILTHESIIKLGDEEFIFKLR